MQQLTEVQITFSYFFFIFCIFKDLSNYKMFARTVWSDDVLAETITDIIYNFELTSLKTLGTSGSDNSKTLMEKINKDKNKKTPQLKTQALKNFSLCDVVE